MTRKHFKQYLMLLLAVGVIAVSLSGGGTFASFTAEVQNPGNTFVTGTLLLHETSGGTTCASESASTNLDVTNPTGCVVLFNGISLGTPASGTLHTDISAGTITSFVADLGSGAATIEPGDLVKVTDGTNTDTFTVTAAVTPGAPVTIPVVSQTSHAYSHTNTTVTVLTYTTFAQIALKDAGTLNSRDIDFDFPTGCTDSAQSSLTLGTTNITADASPPNNPVTTFTLTSGAAYGAPSGASVTITDGTNTDNVTLSSQVNPGDTTIHITSHDFVNSYTGATVSYSPFDSSSLCNALHYSIVETDTSFDHDSTNNAQLCAYGDSSTVGASGIGCDFAGSAPALGSPSSLTGLTISNAVFSNSANELDSGDTRYFVIGVQANVSTLTNAQQNEQAAFAMRWHLDQK